MIIQEQPVDNDNDDDDHNNEDEDDKKEPIIRSLLHKRMFTVTNSVRKYCSFFVCVCVSLDEPCAFSHNNAV